MKLESSGYRRRRLACLICLALLLALAPAATATTTTTTLTTPFVSGTDWATLSNDGTTALGDAQNVCVTLAPDPNPCPVGAANFGSPFFGAWSADLSSIPGATWIWAPGVTGSTSPAEDASYRFRKTVEVPANATNLAGTLRLATDDFAQAYVNGAPVGSVGVGSHGFLTSFDISSALAAGGNLIEIRAQNGPVFFGGLCGSTCTYAQNPAGTVFGGSITYDIATYDFGGFLRPVDNLPTVNIVKAGSAVPVKFSLGSDEGLDIFAAGYPKSQKIPCESATPVEDIEETVTAGGSVLQYDPSTNVYTYVWKTDKSWSRTCRQLVLGLDDGTFHFASFRFN